MNLRMFGRVYSFRIVTFQRRFFGLLSRIWFIPFGFYEGPLGASSVMPHPLVPRDYRDLTLHKMMFPDNILRAIVSDKLAARGWVKERVGCDCLIPLYDVCANPDDLRLAEYPLPFVVKSNHGSGQLLFIRTPADFEGVKEQATEWLSKPFRNKTEWAYRDIDRKILVEKMLVDEQGNTPADIKIHCFYGEAVMIVYLADLQKSFSVHYLDADWQTMETDAAAKSALPKPDKPAELGELMRMVAELTEEFDMIRLDMYIHRGTVYFGELTNFSMAGARHPHKLDYELLPKYYEMRRNKIAALREKYSSVSDTDVLL